jgi:hypothetical protein
MNPSPILEQLSSEARCYVTPAVVAELPCESYRSSAWHRLARVWPFDLFARFEADDNDPETGAECCGLVVELRSAGDRINGTGLWQINLPTDNACPEVWQIFNSQQAEQLRWLIDETCQTSKVRRYLEERYLNTKDLLAATYQGTPLETEANRFAALS